MSAEHAKKYGRVTYDEFKKMASDSNLSVYEKVGFPDSYRENLEEFIFADISYKLNLERENITVLDIGCGCSDLLAHISNNAKIRGQTLILNDSQEMLDQSPDAEHVAKFPGSFPDVMTCMEEYTKQVDAIIIYSVLQHVVLEQNPYSFVDKALEMLKAGGILMLGDIPNYSMRNRFLSSETGIKFHQKYTQSDDTNPPLTQFGEAHERIDDGLLFGMLLRYRGLGFNAYIVPQRTDLPMANRREDLLIHKI